MGAFNLKIDGIDEFRKDLKESIPFLQSEVKKAMVSSVNVVKNEAQTLAPFKTGTLRRSIFTDIKESGFRGVVAQDTNIASYGPAIEFGTAPHEITPVNKKALFWKGALNPYRKIMHPGSKASPFMSPALENNVQRIQKFFEDALLNVVLRMAGKK
jgi:HK97 gp10 family phage protein